MPNADTSLRHTSETPLVSSSAFKNTSSHPDGKNVSQMYVYDARNNVSNGIIAEEAKNVNPQVTKGEIKGNPSIVAQQSVQQVNTPAGLARDSFTATQDAAVMDTIDEEVKGSGLTAEFVDAVNNGEDNASISGNRILLEKNAALRQGSSSERAKK